MVPLFLPHTFLNFVGPATFLFTTHYCILSMGSEALHERGYLNPPSSLLHDTTLSGTTTTQYAPVHADVSTDLSLPKLSLAHTPLVGEDDETCESDDGGDNTYSNSNNNNTIDYFHTSNESLVRPVAVAYAMCAIMIILHGSTGFILFRSVELVR